MKHRRLVSAWLVCTAVVCGAVVMGVELLGARMLSVGYGGSLTVWAAMISVTLLSLAVGYFVGGAVADRAPRPWVLWAIVTASSLLVAACPFARPVLWTCYEHLGVRGGALASSAIVFFLPLGLLGMVSPFVIRLLSERAGGVGITAGSVYAVSTIGSVAGTLATGLWLVPRFGVADGFRIVAVSAAATGVVGLVLCAGWRGALSVGAPILLVLLPVQAEGIGAERKAPDGERVKVEAVKDSHYGHIVVLTKGRYRLLVVNGIVQTGIPINLSHLEKGQGLRNHYYQELIPYMMDDPAEADVLIIGLAGGMTASMLRRYGMRLDCVDLDPAVIETARKWFGFKGEAVAGDGRLYLETTPKRYDVCVLDTYSGDVLPFYLATVEAFRAAKRALRPGGVLVLNFIGSPRGDAFVSVRRTLSAVFRHTLALRGQAGDEVQTITVFASDEPVTFNRGWLDVLGDFSGVDPVSQAIERFTIPPLPGAGRILTDDYNPIEWMRAEEALRWRRRTLENVGDLALF